MSLNGWMDQELFAKWFSNHFLYYAISARPLLLMLDGHSSHCTLDLVKVAAEKNVIIFACHRKQQLIVSHLIQAVLGH